MLSRIHRNALTPARTHVRRLLTHPILQKLCRAAPPKVSSSLDNIVNIVYYLANDGFYSEGSVIEARGETYLLLSKCVEWELECPDWPVVVGSGFRVAVLHTKVKYIDI